MAGFFLSGFKLLFTKKLGSEIENSLLISNQHLQLVLTGVN